MTVTSYATFLIWSFSGVDDPYLFLFIVMLHRAYRYVLVIELKMHVNELEMCHSFHGVYCMDIC